ncbi:MAG: GHKL domain-containing protein [Bacteroidia bacterium]|nr:GHKL domain-containing protein [Bacteroidia bacterium]MBT8270261.1 GHKL domain-containing protein [Bacteroidia bacterium]NNF82347.1 GHKL domain-containing protein [Flavobacteriaceae bacterium]NNK69702.1 GHKL domain-containing protein [Flavobacteriaceae bacterium]NNL79660.1 GHKL domain-containing protein [Flavobacteriaceae bacterium]
MILLVVVASILIAAVTIYQYNEQSRDYHEQRLERKESQLLSRIDYVLRQTTYPVSTDNLPLIFKDKIYEISNIQNIEFNLYGLEGTLLKSSRPSFESDTINRCIPAEILSDLWQSVEKRVVVKNEQLGADYKSSYIVFTDIKSKPIGILNVPYFEDDSFNDAELREFLKRLGVAYFIMFLVAIAFAYFVSKIITKSLKTISDKMYETRLEKQNKKIELKGASQEVALLVASYNSMIDELEESAVKLATSEREQAWREMAKQVAHEIKNPLTPMRLSVQSFQRKFNPDDPEINQKVQEFSKTLIQQIDTMSSIASAFSNFAKMPAQKNENLNVVEVINLALDIFSEDYITFLKEKDEIIAKLDRTQLIRVVTNLVKNAIQAMPPEVDPKIEVKVLEEDKDVVVLISDNGLGILSENKNKIFEPKFTTKSSGMGLGLPIVKNIIETYNGSITFTTVEGKGTTFRITFPKA